MKRAIWKLLTGWVLLAGIAVLRLSAADKATVEQLRSVLAAAKAANEPDMQTAQKIEKLRLTERLTDATLTALLHDSPGPETSEELQVQADRSAFLEPPAAEMLDAPRPSLNEQRYIIARAINYTDGFIHALPDFICTEVIRRLDNDPTRPPKKSEKWKNVYLRDTLEGQLTFRQGRESSVFQVVNGRAYRGKQEMTGMVTRGEFGEMLSSMLLGNSGLKAWWSHWETLRGKRLAVFHYAVDKAHSHYAVSYCCHEIKAPNGIVLPNTIITAFQGELFIEPSTGKIFRATWETMNVPPTFPTRQTNTAVDYGPVSIGGRSYMCPLRSLSTSDSVLYAANSPFTYPIYSINEVRFTDYKKFETEATLLAGSASHEQHDAQKRGAAHAQTISPGVTITPEAPVAPTNVAPEAPPEADAASGTDTAANTQPTPLFALPVPPPYVPESSASAGGDTAQQGQPVMFQEHLNVVTVPVVVRDSQGHAVEDLRKDDFELFDGGKRQQISGFAVERARADNEQPTNMAVLLGSGAGGKQDVELPDRYVAFLIDDLHLSAENLAWMRKAAQGVWEKAGGKDARAAVFSTSGRVESGFTADSAELESVWNRMTPAPHMPGCPDISYYMADRIINGNDTSALGVAAQEAIACGAAMPQSQKPATMGNAVGQAARDTQAERVARMAAMHVLNEQTLESRRVLVTLQKLLRKMAVLPGRRTIVLVSPGFYTSALSSDIDGAIDRAARSGVVVNAVDARGLYVSAGYDVETRGMSSPEMETRKRGFDTKEQQLQSDVLADLAEGTGGTLFENSNDLQGGLARAAERPEVSYVLEFSPQEDKADGLFHSLHVRVTDRKGVTVEARRGYVAPKILQDPAAQAKQELMDAVFSREKRTEVPVTLRTAVTKSGANPGRLAVVSHVDVRSISFEKKDGWSCDTLTAVMSLFDANGEYLKGLQSKLDLNFADEQLAARKASGVEFENDFAVTPGMYWVRLVLRDAEGQMGTAEQGVVVQ